MMMMMLFFILFLFALFFYFAFRLRHSAATISYLSPRVCWRVRNATSHSLNMMLYYYFFSPAFFSCVFCCYPFSPSRGCFFFSTFFRSLVIASVFMLLLLCVFFFGIGASLALFLLLCEPRYFSCNELL